MKRTLTLVALALVGALGVTVALPPHAAQAVVAPGVPNPLNVLPSVVKGASTFGPGSLAFQTYMAKFLGQFAVTAQQQAALTAAAPTPAQTATVADMGKKFKLPAFKMGSLLKGAGAVGLALMADEILVGVGHGVTEAFGIDVEGSVCGTGSSLVAFLSQVDCTEFQMTAEAVAAANADITAGTFWGIMCASGYCAMPVGVNSNGSATCLVMSGTYPGTGALVYGMFNGVEFGTSVRGAPVSSDFGGAGCLNAGLGTTNTIANAAAPRAWYTADALRFVVGGVTSAPVQPETIEDDPQRVLRCQITLSNGAKLQAETEPFTETSGRVPAVVCPDEFPPELSVTNVTIWEAGGGQLHELYNESTTPEYQAAAAYPECSGGACLLDLRAVGTGVSCFQDPVPCADWFESPTKADEYTCWYGSNSVSLGECGVYAPTFKEGAKVGNAPYGDPDTGEPLPGSGPGSALDAPVADPEQPQECFPSGWGVLNPVEWVMKPVQCALQWAFVPRASAIQAKMQQATDAWADTMPGKLGQIVTAWEFLPVVPSGCDGITVDVFFLGPPFQIMQACPGDPLADMAMWSRIFGNLLFGIYGVLAIIRHVARIIGFEGLGEGKNLE